MKSSYKRMSDNIPGECYYCSKLTLGILNDAKDDSEIICCVDCARTKHKIRKFKSWAFRYTTPDKSHENSNNSRLEIQNQFILQAVRE